MPPAPERPPYESYAAITGTFVALLAGAGVLGKKLDRDPQCSTWLDFALLCAASYKTARTLAKDEVTSFIRTPFVEGEAHEGDEEPVRDSGLQQAIGELVTCTRCTGTWVAAGLASTQVLAPRFGRLLTLSLATAGVNDFLQTTFVALNHKSDELKKRAASSE